MSLRSDLFRGDSALQAALLVDDKHIAKGARGSHVQKIQTALRLVLQQPPSNISESEATAGLYGDTTADAVLRFKSENDIVNRAYQTAPDNITGKMTVRALDDAVVNIESELSADILRVIARLDQLLVSERTALSVPQRARFERLRVNALALRLQGGQPERRLEEDFQRGVAVMDTMTRNERPAVALDRRPTVALVALPLVAVAVGAALGAFLIAIAAVIAIILISELLVDAGRLGAQVNRTIEEALAAGHDAVVANLKDFDNLDSRVEQCKRISRNGTAACAAALLRYEAKKAVVIARRKELLSILLDLKDSINGSPKKLIWKILARKAEAAGKALAKAQSELADIADEIIRECGCNFIRI